MNTKCLHKHSAPIQVINILPVTQAGIARHKCAICAYEQGLLDGFKLAVERLQVSDSQIVEFFEDKQKKQSVDKLVSIEEISSKIKEKINK